MFYKSSQIANYFINKGLFEGKGISPIKVIKLTYIAHGWHLAIYDNPLIDECIHAGEFGPTIDSLYHELKKYGNHSIKKFIQSFVSIENETYIKTEMILPNDIRTENFLDKIWDVYGGYLGLQLSSLTNANNTPWKQTIDFQKGKGYLPLGLSISDKIIKKHFKQKTIEK